MAALNFTVTGRKLTLPVPGLAVIATQSEYETCAFAFDSAWTGYVKTAVFYSDKGARQYVVLDDTNICAIPWEVVVSGTTAIYIGVFGINDAGAVLPTNFVYRRVIEGAGTFPNPPTEEVYNTVISELAYLRGKADALDASVLAAATSEANSAASESSAAGSAVSALESKNAAALSEEHAATSETNAAGSAQAAAQSETNVYQAAETLEQLEADYAPRLTGVESQLADIAINIKNYGAVGDGVTDDSASFQTAINAANAKGVPLFLPTGNYLISQSINNVLSLIGVPNKTTVTLASDFAKTSFNSQFCFTNPNFTNGGYNASTADEVTIKHVAIETTPNSARSVFGFANISSLKMDDVKITANKVINQSTGRPYAVDALIDLYASVKNAKIYNCKLNNLTYARGAASPWAAGGGGCIWVRNLLSSASIGAIDANATENIDIYNNILTHTTSDEALAVYGVVGKTRRVNVHHNYIHGLDINPNQVVFHNTLVSVFPLKHSTLGANASVEDVEITDNYISSRSYFYSVLRIGNSSDTNVICQRIKSCRNKIIAYRSSDATYGSQAQWVSSGSSDPSPDTNSLPLRAIQVSNSYSNASASLESHDDTILCSGATANWGITGFDVVSNPTVLGNPYYAIASCMEVIGGNIEASAVCFYNCNNVSNSKVKSNIASTTTWIMRIDATSGMFKLQGVYGLTGGGVCVSTAAATSSTIIDVLMNSVSMSNASAYAVVNGGSAIMTSRLNCITGSMSGGTSGTVASSLNRYGAVTD